MNRRQYLAISGASLSSIAAGCTFLGDGADEGTSTSTLTGTDRHLESVRSALESEGFTLGRLALDDDILVVEYESDAQTEAAVTAESEAVVVAFLEALEAGLDAVWLEAWLIDGDGDARAVYTVHESWARAWDSGEESDEEFFGRIEENVSWQ